MLITATVDRGADPRLAGDAAWAAADLLAVVAQLTERQRGGPYTDAARAFEHAGRSQHRARPLRTPAGRRLRTATTALSAVRVALPSETRQLLQLTQQLTAPRRRRRTPASDPDHAAQAAAARAAVDHLRVLQPRPVVPAPAAPFTHPRHVRVRMAATTPPSRGR
jgi:hypothetical protein